MDATTTVSCENSDVMFIFLPHRPLAIRQVDVLHHPQYHNELLKVLLKLCAEEKGVAQRLVASSDDLQNIAADDNADVPAMRGWRRELFGQYALRLKHGQLGLKLKDGEVVFVELDS